MRRRRDLAEAVADVRRPIVPTAAVVRRAVMTGNTHALEGSGRSVVLTTGTVRELTHPNAPDAVRRYVRQAVKDQPAWLRVTKLTEAERSKVGVLSERVGRPTAEAALVAARVDGRLVADDRAAGAAARAAGARRTTSTRLHAEAAGREMGIEVKAAQDQERSGRPGQGQGRKGQVKRKGQAAGRGEEQERKRRALASEEAGRKAAETTARLNKRLADTARTGVDVSKPVTRSAAAAVERSTRGAVQRLDRAQSRARAVDNHISL